MLVKVGESREAMVCGTEVTSEVRGVGSARRGRYMERVRYVPAAVGVGGKKKFPT